ncbi:MULTISPECIES: N-acetyltransferase [Paraburkholderia]|uniref:GNAT family N-acetyltransferase n=1 Tax=Paraburkholderia TaxID=1822464 RepID=UPI0022525046|nr:MULTISPECIES: GNAT family N-acetyltransferase [Paraburkholderia]MCX4165031.1 GNAT family N-acetyltransferase [Paraburkholderia megapolitana]MDN7160524.1 GNAT family N-acetyltransferase [Paraburkholderia sp. CHISQ3]MDQ6497571.1 GNAT family N-acetyltransferase [Paraburkholderia megapolitana]
MTREKPELSNPDIEIRLTDVEQPEARDFISRKLDEYNDSITNQADNRVLDVLITDPVTKEVVGGLVGRTSLGLFFINLVYVPENLRKGGIGTAMLKEAEAEAKRRGCSRAVLFTITFQAPEFYLKHGYRIFGEIPCEPEGTARIYMVKVLEAGC